MITRDCDVCGATFTHQHPMAKRCGDACRYAHTRSKNQAATLAHYHRNKVLKRDRVAPTVPFAGFRKFINNIAAICG